MVHNQLHLILFKRDEPHETLQQRVGVISFSPLFSNTFQTPRATHQDSRENNTRGLGHGLMTSLAQERGRGGVGERANSARVVRLLCSRPSRRWESGSRIS